jgi:hypothetical protein
MSRHAEVYPLAHVNMDYKNVGSIIMNQIIKVKIVET